MIRRDAFALLILPLAFAVCACAAKQKAPAAAAEKPALSQPQPAPAPSAPITVTDVNIPPKALKQKELMKIIAAGYGAAKEDAEKNALLEALKTCAELLAYEGELFINHPEALSSLFTREQDKFIDSYKVIFDRTEGGIHKVEVSAMIDHALLKDRALAVNGANLTLTPPQNLGEALSGARKERGELIKSFAALFPNMESLIKARITGLNYVESRVENGRVPVRVSFELYVDKAEYNNYAAKLVDIIVKKMGGSLAYEAPIIKDGEELQGYALPEKAPLDDHLLAVVIDGALKVYYVGEAYLELYRALYREGKITGSPYGLEFVLKLKGADGRALYEDYITPFNYQRNYRYDPEPIPSYPAVYIVNKSAVSAYNGRFLNNSPSHNLEGAVNAWAEHNRITDNPMRELRTFENNFIKKALLTPYIVVRISKKRAAVPMVSMEYEGLIDLSLVKKIKSVELEYK